MKKGLCTLIVLSVLSTNAFSKEKCSHSNFEQNLDEITEATAMVDNCPKPKPSKLENFCDVIGSQGMEYEIELNSMACVKDSDLATTKKEKVQVMWSKYKNEFTCERDGFMVKDGNVLKLSVFSNFSTFLDGLVNDFEIDINYVDPADGKNVLDFTRDEIARLTSAGNQPDRLKELKQMYNHLKNNLRAKHTESYAQN